MTKKNEIIKVDAHQYGIILSEVILISGDDYPDFCKAIDNKEDYFEYLTYLEYFLYISQKILEKEYSKEIVEKIIRSSMENIVDCLDFIKVESKDKFKNYIKEHYKLIKEGNYDVFDESGLKKLINQFEKDFKLTHDPIIDSNIMIEFTGFIKYHLEDVLNKNLEIIE